MNIAVRSTLVASSLTAAERGKKSKKAINSRCDDIDGSEAQHGKKKEEAEAQGRTTARARARGEKYAGPVAGAVFTTVRGVTGYYSDGPRARREAPRRAPLNAARRGRRSRSRAADEPEAARRAGRRGGRPEDEEEEEELEGKPAWAALGLHTALVDATTAVGWSKPTRIQRKAIPWHWQVEM